MLISYLIETAAFAKGAVIGGTVTWALMRTRRERSE